MKICLNHIVIALLLFPMSLCAQQFGKTDIEKYKAALKINPNDSLANYQMAFALNGSGKGMKALPFLEKVYLSNDVSEKRRAEACRLSGKILLDNGRLKRAIAVYSEGVKMLKSNSKTATGGYRLLNNDLGFAYFKDKQYNKAESKAAEGFLDDSTHADSYRLYGLTGLHQKVSDRTILALCSFVLLSTDTTHYGEAYDAIQQVIERKASMPRSAIGSSSTDDEYKRLEQAIADTLAVFVKSKYASDTDVLAAQLGAIFKVANAEYITHFDCFGDAYKSMFVYYFYKLSQTEHIPTLARLIGINRPENTTWVNAHPREVAALKNWVKLTPRWSGDDL